MNKKLYKGISALLVASMLFVPGPLALNGTKKQGVEAAEVVDKADVKKDELRFEVFTVGRNEREKNLTWYSGSQEAGWLEYGEDLNDKASTKKLYAQQNTNVNAEGYTSNQVTLTELKPNTTYQYRYGNGKDSQSEIKTFKTNAQDGNFNFILAGDPQIGASGNIKNDTQGWNKTLHQVDKKTGGVDFILSAGDQMDAYGDAAKNPDKPDKHPEKQYAGFIEVDGMQGKTLAPVIGNHDEGDHEDHAYAYSEHFANPNVTGLAKTRAGSNYYFVYENTLFIVLNSNSMNTAEQRATIEEAINATKDLPIRWKVVTFHHSIYSTASHTNDEDIIARRQDYPLIFKDYDIDLVLMGHDHVYTRTHIMKGATPLKEDGDEKSGHVHTDPDGILYITANSASGSKNYPLVDQEYNFKAVDNQEDFKAHYAYYSNIEVTNDQIKITTYKSRDNEPIDEVTIKKASPYKYEPQDYKLSTGEYTELKSSVKETDRIAGKDRIDTAVSLSKKNYKQAESVILASAENYPDTLSATSLADALQAPILLTNKDSLDSRVQEEIERLGAKKVIIVGGDRVISDKLSAQVEKNARVSVERLAGKDRYETSSLIADCYAKLNKGIKSVILASGENYVDALSSAPLAGKEKAPILLVKKDQIPDSIGGTLSMLKPESAFIAGGDRVISRSIEEKLPKSVRRFAGRDRYETAKFIAEYSNPDAKNVILASGLDFPDALAAGPVAIKNQTPILLAGKDLPRTTKDYISKQSVEKVTLVGGDRVISNKIAEDLKK